MKKETKIKLAIGFVALTILGMILPDQKQKQQPVEKEKQQRQTQQKKNLAKKLNLITDLQDYFYNKPLTKEMLKKYPSFNEITKDFRPLGENLYYLYSPKYNIELKVKNGKVDMLWEGSRFKN